MDWQYNSSRRTRSRCRRTTGSTYTYSRMSRSRDHQVAITVFTSPSVVRQAFRAASRDAYTPGTAEREVEIEVGSSRRSTCYSSTPIKLEATTIQQQQQQQQQIDATPGLVAGLAKSFATRSAVAISGLFKGLLKLWFRNPTKLFRPSNSVNPLLLFTSMASQNPVNGGAVAVGWRVLRDEGVRYLLVLCFFLSKVSPTSKRTIRLL